MSDGKDPKAAITPGDMEESSSYGAGKEASSVPTPGGDVDVAAKYANQFTGENAWTMKEWRRLRWKLDMRLVPLLWFNVTLGAMDKVSSAHAARPARGAWHGFFDDTDQYEGHDSYSCPL